MKNICKAWTLPTDYNTDYNPHIKIRNREVDAFNVELSCLAQYEQWDRESKHPLTKLIIDFYTDNNFFERIYPGDVVPVELELYGNKTILQLILKKSNVHVPASGIVTYRMIFKNR